MRNVQDVLNDGVRLRQPEQRLIPAFRRLQATDMHSGATGQRVSLCDEPVPVQREFGACRAGRPPMHHPGARNPPKDRLPFGFRNPDLLLDLVVVDGGERALRFAYVQRRHAVQELAGPDPAGLDPSCNRPVPWIDHQLIDLVVDDVHRPAAGKRGPVTHGYVPDVAYDDLRAGGIGRT